jgi:TPR repeat protein
MPQSDRDAFDWYKRAASQGAPVAQLNLGILYADGRGVAADPVLAHMWLNLGAAALPPGAVRNSAARLRDTVTARLTPEQTATAHRLARDWKPTPPTPQK